MAVLSLCISAGTTGFTASTMFFYQDTSPEQRRRSPEEWGAIPDTGRDFAFAVIFALATLQVLAKGAAVRY